MPESEMFKAIVQGGSFAMMVLFFVWLLFKAEPNYRATVERMASEHQKAADSMCRTFETALNNQSKSFEAMVERMQTHFQEALENQEKQCRAERKEWMEVMRTEGEMNRKAITELYASYGLTCKPITGPQDPKT